MIAKSLSHFSRREQHALHYITNTVKEHGQPVMLFYIDSDYRVSGARSIFTGLQKEESWHFSARLLLVEESGCQKNADIIPHIQHALPSHIAASFFIYDERQINEYIKNKSLFFTWLMNFGVLLYKEDLSGYEIIQSPISKKEYWRQMKEWYERYPDLQNGFDIRLRKRSPGADSGPALHQCAHHTHYINVSCEGDVSITLSSGDCK